MVVYIIVQTVSTHFSGCLVGNGPLRKPATFSAGTLMRYETPYSALIRLREEQTKTREDEVFLGLSPAERAQYDQKAQRINALEMKLRMSNISEKSTERGAALDQRSLWNQQSETDTPRARRISRIAAEKKDLRWRTMPISETKTQEKAERIGKKKGANSRKCVRHLPRSQWARGRARFCICYFRLAVTA